ncbi:DEAD/DEAH box helicase [Psychroserpens sp.]|uniref:DEAD/DEAH box helicase n=1 Tax=Psychroserpens sp. TaxID=2020870 RepID=UPI001B021C32|nr:DEAD/DEAH box helicase family protein [Psychroserpens sp.]MBO6606506.1 DEAD/DEAH box helicase family protein [Psychroserpens sp.]MBO6630416.1 DEAD/DEAH box helicase family protein [Psychroserpens sp.]MBO6653210.1 DEAD/DEAH box helicase family protein [Psychroserpens sp.]MBO6680762.1 DEAD/DEAH box helicase family protein [Psychroserpens sp.]MBO6750280.1 DEAD/DEAH box helicase family protein [Psychroserpens sp.]
MSNILEVQDSKVTKKKLYDYQIADLNRIFEVFDSAPDNYNLLYQLPTGGGKTVIFSEIVRRYIKKHKKKVVILTHRIELCKQTSKVLHGFDVNNKIINSKVKELPDQDQYECFVAMVETLNNRLNDGKLNLEDIGLVIIDEAHYNSFRKLFKFFDNCFILGVTATPLSSNIKLPMKDNYKELIVGDNISTLIKNGFLASAEIYNYDVSLTTLKIGINGDYTVKSSEALYTNTAMQSKLLQAYDELSKGRKTLIFNNGINTSKEVYYTFKRAGYNIRHLDNTSSKQERKEILKWFKNTPDGILTSVSILTTGFDEPSVESIILNRATRSLTLYFQMIGRGSRIHGIKNTFRVIDLGNNAVRFGPWSQPVDWQHIFKNPDYYLENLRNDEDIEREFVYKMPESLRKRFKKRPNDDFDIKEEYKKVIRAGKKSMQAIENSIAQHSELVIANSEDVFEARELAKLLHDDICYRIKQYCYCIMNSTKNYKDWLIEEYTRKLRLSFNGKF